MTTKKTRKGLYQDRSAPLTQDVLKATLEYDPLTGVFSRKVTWHRYKAGSIAGSASPSGYIYIAINGIRYFAHRLAWLYMTGSFPDEYIDHINGVKSDNKWANLREVSRTVNGENQRRAHLNNSSGFLGVRKNSKGGSWSARIRVAGKLIQIGSFPTPTLAHQAYIDAKRKLHAGCTL